MPVIPATWEKVIVLRQGWKKKLMRPYFKEQAKHGDKCLPFHILGRQR
jgi:hypothetical protein